jgi:hypothetical protein
MLVTSNLEDFINDTIVCFKSTEYSVCLTVKTGKL